MKGSAQTLRSCWRSGAEVSTAGTLKIVCWRARPSGSARQIFRLTSKRVGVRGVPARDVGRRGRQGQAAEVVGRPVGVDLTEDERPVALRARQRDEEAVAPPDGRRALGRA